MKDDLAGILFSEEEIARRVGELGAQITSDYSGKTPILLGVLKGSFVFMADLARRVDLPCETRFVSASSYGTSAVSSGTVKISATIDFEIANRDIIIIEDILDTGITVNALREHLESFSPASVRLCVMLDKVSRHQVPVTAEYIGFECPDEFIVGYGLDYAEKYRNLPFIAALKPEIYS